MSKESMSLRPKRSLIWGSCFGVARLSLQLRRVWGSDPSAAPDAVLRLRPHVLAIIAGVRAGKAGFDNTHDAEGRPGVRVRL